MKPTLAMLSMLTAGLTIGCAQSSSNSRAEAQPTSPATSPTAGYHSTVAGTPDAQKWVQVDLGRSCTIEQVNLFAARTSAGKDLAYGFPPRFLVEISDDPEFRRPQILAELTAGDFVVPENHPFEIIVNAQKARYVRVTAKKLWERTNDYIFALAELQVFSGGTNVALNAEVSALDSIENGTWSKRFLVDGYSSRRKLPNVLALRTEHTKSAR